MDIPLCDIHYCAAHQPFALYPVLSGKCTGRYPDDQMAVFTMTDMAGMFIGFIKNFHNFWLEGLREGGFYSI